MKGFVYISVDRAAKNMPSERELLRSRTDDLNTWETVPLPEPRAAPWGHVKIFTDDRRLFCAATPNRKKELYRVHYQSDDGQWKFITDFERVRYDFRIAIAHGMLMIAGGNLPPDEAECHDVNAYPLNFDDLTGQRWIKIATDPVYRCVPAILSHGNRIYILGGTSGNPDVPTTQVTTLIRLAAHTYQLAPALIPPMPVGDCFATIVNGVIVITGGKDQASGSGRRRRSSSSRSRQCNFFDPIKETWESLSPLCRQQTNPELFAYDNSLYCLWGIIDDGEEEMSSKIEVLSL